MSVIQTVTVGQPIRASWANSIVNEVNNKVGLSCKGKYTYSHYNTPSKAMNDAAWQISYSCGTYSLNAGQIYINGHLVTNGHTESTVTTGEGEEAQTHYVNSYNMYSSCTNWYENCNYTPTDATDLPIWFITITSPKATITKDNISEVVAKLVVTNDEQQVPQPEGVDDNKEFTVIQVNTIDGFNLIQLVSGTIYLNEAMPSLVAGDGIKIVEVDEALIISSNPEVIANVDVDVRAGDNVKVVKSVDNTTRVFTVHANVPTVSLLAGDGIQVDASQHGNVTAYTISNTYSTIPYDFDEEWFIVTNGVVTFNTEKLVQLAEEIAANTTVNVNVTGIVDEVKTGSVQVNTTGINNGTATTNVRIV